MKVQVLLLSVMVFVLLGGFSLSEGKPMFKAIKRRQPTTGNHMGNNNQLRFQPKKAQPEGANDDVDVIDTDMDDEMEESTQSIISNNAAQYDTISDLITGIQRDMEDEYGIGWSVVVVDVTDDTDWSYSIYHGSYFMYARVSDETVENKKEILVFDVAQFSR